MTPYKSHPGIVVYDVRIRNRRLLFPLWLRMRMY